MKTITIAERSKEKLHHIEAPGCIVNIHTGLINLDGNKVTSIGITTDAHYAGEPTWYLADLGYAESVNLQVVQCEKPIHKNANRTNKLIYGRLILNYEAEPRGHTSYPKDGIAFFHSDSVSHSNDLPTKATQHRFLALAANPAYHVKIEHLWGGGIRINIGRADFGA